MDWYIVVKNNPEAYQSALLQQQLINLAIAIAVIMLVVFITVILTRRYQRRIMHLATTDVLTGLFNRRAMETELNQMLADTNKSHNPLCMFIFDIDDFKRVNGTHGHVTGDAVLARTVSVAREYLKESMIYRLGGGDKFAGVIYQGIDSADATLEGLRRKIEQGQGN